MCRYLLNVVFDLDNLPPAEWQRGGGCTTVAFCKLWTENGGTTLRLASYAPNFPRNGTFHVPAVGIVLGTKCIDIATQGTIGY